MQLVKNCRIYTPIDRGTPLAGKFQGEITCYQHGAMIIENGMIVDIGSEVTITDRHDTAKFETIDCRGQCVIPGFVDPHTHMCFAALREDEFERRIEGTPYLEILKQGGGILSSVRSVADATLELLVSNTRTHVRKALSLGTTTIEIKSGYGLDTENELKMLEAIGRIAKEEVIDVVPTFLGAHAIPERYRSCPDDYISLVVEEMLPAVKHQGIAQHCDVFCEKNVFTIAQGKKVLQAAKALGFLTKIHADEVHDLGGAALAAELGAISADHLLAASDAGIQAMGREGVVATLLPATAYSLRKPFARARDIIAGEVPVALATDCNPGSSFTESMPFVIGLAVLKMLMSPAEALTASTLNSAYAIGMAHKVGSLEPEKQADFIVLDGHSPAMLAYHAGVSPITRVYKKGIRIQ